MNIVEKIEYELDKMTKAERQVSLYFIQHPNDFLFYTLDKIARMIGTSTTSVIRFCRRIGFAGYKEFQNQLREENNHNPSLSDRFNQTANGSSETQLLSKILAQNTLNIEQTFSSLPLDQLENAVELLQNGKQIFLFGMRESYALVHYAFTRFITVRSRVHVLEAGYNGLVEPLLDLTSEDVCLIFLFHRYTEQSLYILPLLKESGIKTILITSSPYDSVSQYADVLLPCHVEAQGVKNTYVAPICLVDYFCNAVALQSYEDSMNRFSKIEKLLQHNNILGS